MARSYNKDCVVCSSPLDSSNCKQYNIDNYIYKCNECIRTEKREAAKSTPKSISTARSDKYRKKLKEENPIKYSCIQMVSSAHKRAKKFNLPFDIDTEYLLSIAVERCPVFSKSLKYGGGSATDMSPSLDRIVPTKGYVKGNVQIISNLANQMKSSASAQELIQFADWIYENVKEVSVEK